MGGNMKRKRKQKKKKKNKEQRKPPHDENLPDEGLPDYCFFAQVVCFMFVLAFVSFV